ncbi:MAG: hypothetical protein ABR511_04180 [Acidimicrobiales bacterium]
MAENDEAAVEEEEEESRFPMGVDPPDVERHEDDPGEVRTSFATTGLGWSGRDDDDL